MNGFDSERPKPWNIYTNSDPSSSQATLDRETPWKSFGASMNAISFGFVATAILISLFLIMAIFEHLFRPSPSFTSPEPMNNSSLEAGETEKLRNPQLVSTYYASDIPVLMPAQRCPTYIAQPAPLPCPREGFYRPYHEDKFSLSVCSSRNESHH
ncbi:hypothetical protein ACJRO7_036239 [Eucalyptus globulus]|uniref:Uncharacterized protein n=1 Tax=Eucalyptus globulus TaxID=34317 RepID=A0ABD3JDH4_EUCGL